MNGRFKRKIGVVFRNQLLSTVLGTGLLALCFAACSEQRRGADKDSITSVESASANYQYPHPSNWSADHVAFVSKFGGKVAGTSKDCTTCHNADSQKSPSPVPQAPPMNVSCAMACHTPKIGGEPPASPPHGAPGEGKDCLKCHADHAARAKPHYPAAAGQCRTCHEVTPEHLAKGGPSGAKTRPPEQSCYSCHFRVDRKPEVHPALALDNSCANCHDAHGSEQRFFLKQPTVEALCVQCHTMSDSSHKSVHGPLKGNRSCLECHDPHSSDHKRVLTAKPQQLCLSCHDRAITTKPGKDARTIPNIKEQITAMPFVHGPARQEEGCLDCHNPHASKFDRLVTKPYPGESYAPYEPGNATKPNTYALCFQCHDAGMLNKDIAGDETGFRDDRLVNGKVVRKNLHWFHVVDATGSSHKESGRSCFICHDPHGAPQEHNIKSSWRMSGQHSVTIEYTPKPTGGECTRSCHDLRAYKRAE